MALLRRNKDPQTELPEAPIQVETPVSDSVVADVQQVPEVSFNLMTVRYIVQRRRNIVSLITLGLVAVAILLAIGQWLRLNNEALDLEDQISAVEAQISTLNQQITELSDTAGLTPDQVAQALNDRAAAFRAAVSGELDYIRLFNDLRALDNQTAWVTQITFSRPEDGGTDTTLALAGKAVNHDDAILWNSSLAQIPYLSAIPRLPAMSGTPGDPGGGLAWSIPSVTANGDVVLDRAALHELSDLPNATAPAPVDTEQSDEGSEDETTDTTAVEEGGEQ